jgi:ribosomal protein L24
VAHVAIASAVTVHVLLYKRNVGAAVSWIGIAWLSPFLGALLYATMGVNRVKRHTKVVNQGGRAGTTGGIITQEAPIHASNVMLLTEVDGKKVPSRVGAKRIDVTKNRADGTTYPAQRSVRVASKNGEEI